MVGRGVVDRVAYRCEGAHFTVCSRSSGLQKEQYRCIYTYMADFQSQLTRTRHCTCSTLRRATRAVTAHYEAHFRGSGLRGTQFTILSFLAQAGSLPITRLAYLLGVERTTLTRNLTILARRGLVEWVGEKDGRVRKAALTKAGDAMLHKCMPLWLAAEASAGKVLKNFRLPQVQA
jgi:DNA-binding MarR family transcriptional regulator